MASIDNRVVEMKFDNTAFESKLATTIESLGKLETSLKFSNANKGFQDINAAAGTVKFGSMISGIENLSSKFSALSVLGFTVLTNIANRATDAGIEIAKSLSLKQVLSGFQEYETNMRSIQTILSNTKKDNTTLGDVNGALDTLNEYSDKTIYNFSQMAKNIGTFTAAGVDLNTSTQSIKGIANLAAISGSSADQASNAMYQLSQAISTGTLKLIDWNSVTNAGMGGKVFQDALFETGKALGTIKNVPMDMTFKQWTDAGNTFRGSLEDGWVTSNVLTTTLRGFTGEMTEAQLLTIGYTKEQAAAVLEMGQTGIEAATKVRTFTQLMSTAKESVASGFSRTFRIIIGDFESATTLFTNINNVFSGLVTKAFNSSSAILEGWSDFGGRKAIISGLADAFGHLADIVKAVRKAFEKVFPPTTAAQLTRLSFAFEDFISKLKPSGVLLAGITIIFQGLFSAVKIVFTIIKEFQKSARELTAALFGLSDGKIFAFLKDLARYFTDLNETLTTDGGIAKTFEKITQAIIDFAKDPLAGLSKIKDSIAEALGGIFDSVFNIERLAQRFETIKNTFGALGEAIFWIFEKARDAIKSLSDTFAPVIDALEGYGSKIVGWFKGLAGKMKAAAEPGDFNNVLDAVNLGIVASIGAMLAFLNKGLKDGLKNGINVDVGGVVGQLKSTFGGINIALSEATNVLRAMQADIKSNAILKIGMAIGVLAIAVLLLASVDSVALTRGLVAIAAGLGLLIGSLTLLTANVSVKGSGSFTILAIGLTALSAAIVIMALAIRLLSGLNPAELVTGLTGIAAVLGLFIATSKLLQKHAGGMIRSGIGLIAIAIGVKILAGAVVLFASMTWEEMARGLTGVVIGLTGIALAMKLMPWNSLPKAAGLIMVAISLNILAIAVKLFAMMSVEDLVKGFSAIAIGLTLIALAMHLMPTSLPLTAAGLLAVSVALLIVSGVVQDLAALSWEELGRGLAGMAAALIILVGAAHLMSGAIGGAIAMGIMAIALSAIGNVLEKLGALSWSEIIKGLVALAGVFAVIGLAATLIAPTLGPLFALAGALLLIGLAIGAFGLGVNALARGIQILVDLGTNSVDWIFEILDRLIERIPILVKGLIVALIAILSTILEALPVLLEQLVIVVGEIIDALITLLPKLSELIIALIDTIITIVDEKAVDVFEAGYRLLIGLIEGIADNVDEYVAAVAELITNFVNALAENIGPIIDAGVNLLKAFVQGIIDNIVEIATMVAELIVAFINALALQYTVIIQAGVDLLVQFLSGVKDNITKVTDAVVEIITTMITAIGDGATRIAQAGADALSDFLGGISDGISTIGDKVEEIITKFLDELGSWSNSIIIKGIEVMATFIRGLGVGALTLVYVAAETVTAFAEGIADAIEKYAPRLRQAGIDIAFAVADGFTFGLAGKLKSGDWKGIIGDFALGPFGMIKNVLGINSPSKLYMGLGEGVVEGFALGMSKTGPSDRSAMYLAKSTTDTFTRSLQSLSDSLDFTNEFNPTITPVLDLTNVRVGAREISGLISSTNGINATVSTGQAQTIALTELNNDSIPTSQNGSNELRFEQNIYAPTQLSVSDIYRQTRNQITLAKEELSIL